MKIPVCKPDITAEDVEAVKSCVESGWISGISPQVKQFEEAFAKYVGSKYAITVNSGTTALQVALACLGITKDDEVIIPTFTMIATPNSVKYLGAKNILVDCYRDTWNINVGLIEQKITDKTKVILPVHVYGHPCRMYNIISLARKHGLFVVDDAAEAIGSEIYSKKIGSVGDLSCFSLYANKMITAGEGGLITTDNKKWKERCDWLRSHCFGRGGKHFYHEELGFGYRMTAMQASLGLSQLNRVEQYVVARRNHAEQYMGLLERLVEQKKIGFPVEKRYFKNTYWMFTILIHSINRDLFMKKMLKKGVETRPVFTPIHNQPVYKQEGDYDVSDKISLLGVNLPSSNVLSCEEIEYVCKVIKKIV